LHTAIEHRLMHAETFAYIMHQLDYDKKVAQQYDPWPAHVGRIAGRAPRMIAIEAGQAQLGINGGDGFGWDNEFQSHSIEVPPFRVSQYKVTNAEYLEFVQAGAAAPFFWKERDGVWHYHGMFAELPLPPDWPVYVTH